MLAFAFWTLAITVLAGAGLAFLYFKPRWPQSPLAAAVHGIVGSFGLAILALSLKTAGAAATQGLGAFAGYAAILTGLAWVGGLVLAFLPLRAPRSRSLLIAGHGGLALVGFGLLLAYWVLGK